MTTYRKLAVPDQVTHLGGFGPTRDYYLVPCNDPRIAHLIAAENELERLEAEIVRFRAAITASPFVLPGAAS